MKKQAHIVVAHYNENIDWLLSYDKSDITIYSKGNQISSKYGKIIETKNIGHEAHSYLKFIIDNYENLPEYVFFTQGNPFDHIIHNLNFYIYPEYSIIGKFVLDKSYKYYLTNMHITEWKGKLDLCEDPFDIWFMKYIDSSINPKIDNLFICYGAIFTIQKKHILSRSKLYYEELIQQLNSPHPETAHFLERSWYYIFNLHINLV